MKKTLVLGLTALAITLGGASASAEGLVLQAEKVKPTINNIQAKPAKPTFTATIVAPLKCMPGYNKTYEHTNNNGGIDKMECQSPVFECPHKSKVKNSKGYPATGQGIDLKKVPVGGVDSNKFKIEYKCTYFWPQG